MDTPSNDVVPAWRRRDTVIVLGLLALFLLLRLVLIDADPPAELPQGRGPWELLREGAAKAHEARNWALYGTWQTSPADNYQFWRPQSPLWVYPLAGFFEVFGVGTVQLRVYSLLGAALGYAAFLWVAAQRLRGPALLLAGTFLACNYYYVLYTRCGLLEPLVNTFWTIGLGALLLAWQRPRWLVVAHLGLLAAFLVKMTGALLGPVFLVATTVILRRAWQRGEASQRREVALVLLAMAAMIAFAAWYVSRDDFLRALGWNFGHYFGEGEGHEELDVEQLGEVSLWDRVTDQRRYWARGLALFPLTAPLAVVGMVEVVKEWRAGKRDPWSACIAAWFVLAALSVLVGGGRGLRYRLVAFPPVAWLAAKMLHGQLREAATADKRRMMAIVLASFLGLHAYWYGSWAVRPSYQVRDLNRRIPQVVGEDGVIIGSWAPWLVFDSRVTFYYVKRLFNATPEALESFGVTHLLLRPDHDATREILEGLYPRAMQRLRPEQSYAIYGEPIDLYRAPAPLAQPPR